MMGADGQKYFTLRIKRELINDGFFKYTRNPNYLGEIMIYASFALLVGRWEILAYFVFIWAVFFNMRMYIKDLSLMKKKGWEKYSKQSYILLPKVFRFDVLNYLFYAALISGAYLIYQAGGIENITKLVRM